MTYKSLLLSLVFSLYTQMMISRTSEPTSSINPKNPDKSHNITKNTPQKNKASRPKKNDRSDLHSMSLLDEMPDLISEIIPHTDPKNLISEPLHTSISSNIRYSQYLSAVYGGNDGQGDSGKGSTGYAALNNGMISREIPFAQDQKKAELLAKMQDPALAKALFAEEGSPWRSAIIQKRVENTLKAYLEDQQLLHLAGTHTISYQDITTMDFYILQTQKSVVVINDDIPKAQRQEIDYLAHLIPPAAQHLAHVHAHKDNSFKIAPDELYRALSQEAHKTPSKSGVHFEKRLFDTHLASLPTLSGELKPGKNHNELYSEGILAHSATYGPSPEEGLNGSWLSSTELKSLAEAPLMSEHPVGLTHKPSDIHFLEYSPTRPLEERLANSFELSWLRTQLEHKPKEFSTLFLISFDKEWASCFITLSQGTVHFTLVDGLNKDRHLEQGLTELADIIHEALTNKAPAPKKKNDDLLKDLLTEKESSPDAKKSDVNYDAPLAHLQDDEIPTLEDLFGEKIPNTVMVSIKHMQKDAPKRSAGTKLKNCLLLYGPPGTGKSTIAQVMARKAGRSIVYAGGGDFRDAYQGSGKAKLDALFAEAKRRKSIILIDEIDGTSSRLQPHNSTQEDNRAVKALITTLDQHRQDPDVFVICTTNYPENIDPAIMRRFKTIEITLPDYQKRKKIIDYYLKQNNIAVASRTPDALSPDFYDKLLSATDGFSGDALGEMINSAVYEFEGGLEPEHRINIDFRTKGIDLSNKSILANLGELLRLPLTPLFMMIGESALDKHVYSQYRRQIKLRDDLKENERKNDPTDKYAKEPFFTRLAKRNWDNAGNALERGFWELIIRAGWKKAFNGLSIHID